MSAPNLANMKACVQDVRAALLDGDEGLPLPRTYEEMRQALEGARDSLPPLYQDAFWRPFVAAIEGLGAEGFTRIVFGGRQWDLLKARLFDIAAAILQVGSGYQSRATKAFQEVVSDLYDGFLSAEDRRGIKPPDRRIVAPLVRWGEPQRGPFAVTVDSPPTFGVEVAVICLPPANARSGLMTWASLAHESAHDILQADDGLLAALGHQVEDTLKRKNSPFADYWSMRVEEAAADVLGMLNMGPASAVGLIAYLRGQRWAGTGKDELPSAGEIRGAHPIAALRGYMAASVVRQLDFAGSDAWGQAIKELTEVSRGGQPLTVGGRKIDEGKAVEAAELVGRTLVEARVGPLEGHALGQVQTWTDKDEEIVSSLSERIATLSPAPADIASGVYAAHAVAAAVKLALSGNLESGVTLKGLQEVLKQMHDGNLSWGPLYVAHPGDIYRRNRNA